MSMSEQEKKKIMQERAKQFFNEDIDDNSLRDEITDVVETTLGKCSASDDIVNNLILLIEHRYGEIE